MPASMAATGAAGLAGWLRTPSGVSATGGPVSSRLGQIAWALYEGGRNPYVLLVTIYLFAPYFSNYIVADPVRGQQIWGFYTTLGALATAFAAPFLGAVADVGGRRKPWIALYTVTMIIAVMFMWFGVPHASTERIMIVGLLVGLANFSFEFTAVFHNAMLPTIAPHERVGPLSGMGLAFGNASGILLLVFMCIFMALPGRVHWGFVPAHPIFGISQAAHEPERLAGPIAGLWLMVLSLPLFFFTPDKPGTGMKLGAMMIGGMRSVFRTIRSLRHYRNVATYLVARTIFQDGMTAALTFGGIYASGTFHWDALTMIVYGLELSVFAVVGGFFGGWLDNTVGSKRALFVSVGGTTLFFVAMLTMAPDRIFWVIPYDVHAAPINALPFFNTWPEVIFLMIVNGIAVCITAGYANIRTMMARLSPPEKMTEFFGLMSFSGTSTAFIANAAVTTLTALTHSQRGGMSAIFAFLVIGLLGMFFVKEERAVAV
jgi:UMF1 family MFS transporter